MDNLNCPAKSNERGNALLVVMMATILIMGISGALVDHFATSEADAISESLAKIRIHWAMRGQLDMLTSRARDSSSGYAGDSTKDDVTDRATPLQTLLTSSLPISSAYVRDVSGSVVTDTIVEVKGTDANSIPLTRWYYPEGVGSNKNYIFDIATKISDNNVVNESFGSLTATDGRIFMQFEVRDPEANTSASVIPVPVLQTLVKRRVALRVDVCTGNRKVSSRTVGDLCTVIADDADQDDAGNLLVTTIERFSAVLAPVPP